MDNGQLPIDSRFSVERLSALERAIWSEKMKCGSNLEVALKLFLYEDVVERYLETIVRKLREGPRVANPGGDRRKHLEPGIAVPWVRGNRVDAPVSPAPSASEDRGGADPTT